MGQKVNPHGLRVGIIKDWDSRWYADNNSFADNLVEDYKIREFVKKNELEKEKKPMKQKLKEYEEMRKKLNKQRAKEKHKHKERSL